MLARPFAGKVDERKQLAGRTRRLSLTLPDDSSG